ncbi:MAG: hypothetical protein KA477_01200 [Candidatus Levybacteria bacterium]|nr:hypothetical protein [Candidatus Levybacteria bacterium]
MSSINENERALVPSLMLSQEFQPSAVQALASSFRGTQVFTEIQETLEGFDRNFDMQSNGYLDLAWGLLISGKNPDPYIHQAQHALTNYKEELSRDLSRRKGYLNSDRLKIFDLDLKIAQIASQRGLQLASVAVGDAYDMIKDYECVEHRVDGRNLLNQDRLDTNQSGQYIREYALVVAPSLVEIAKLLKKDPGISGLDPSDLLQQAESILFDGRVKRDWAPDSLAKCAEMLLKFYVENGDIESVNRVYGEILARVKGDMRGDTVIYDRALVPVKTWVSTFNAQVARAVNLDALTSGEIEQILLSSDSDAQKALGKILSPEESNEILEREDIPNSAKESIIDGLQERLREQEASVRNTRLLLDSKRKEFKEDKK